MDTKLRLGQIWKHNRKGTLYTIKALANLGPILRGEPEDPKFPPMVVYQDEAGNVWSRKIRDWKERFTLVNEGIPEPNVIKFDTTSKENRVIVVFSDGHIEEYDRDDRRFHEMQFKVGEIEI
jgi:hypothetical protein